MGKPILKSSDGLEVSETAETILDFLELNPALSDLISQGFEIKPSRPSGTLLQLELLRLLHHSPGKPFSTVRA